VYAKQKLSPLRSRGRFSLRLVLLAFLVACPGFSRADSLEEGARALARKAGSSLHGVSISYEGQNLSSLSGKEFSNLSAVFQEELLRLGAKILPVDAAAAIVLTVTENPNAYIGIVQIRRKESSENVMEVLGPIEGAPAAELTYGLMVHKEFLFAQDAPILDLVFEGDARHASVLGTQAMASYELQGDRWTLTGAGQLPVHRSSHREPRGFLYFGINSQAAYLPGEVCTVSMPDAQGWKCEKYSGAIPIRSVSPDTVAEKKMGLWISAAQLGPAQATRIVATGLDGLARLYEDGPDPVAVFSGWGSEIASVHSRCGSGWQLLVTGQGDWTRTDTIQAMEIQERQAQPVSSPLEVAGAVTALHALAPQFAGDGATGASALAVVRNLQTGRYEAYRLSITCSN